MVRVTNYGLLIELGLGLRKN